MRRRLLSAALGLLCSSVLVISGSAFADDAPAKDQAGDEAAVRAAVASYVKAYDAGDAAAVADLFAESGEWVTADGIRLRGRKAITEFLRASFAAAPGTKLEVVNPVIRLLTKDVALEEGTARVKRDGNVVDESTYQAIHVRRQGGWKLESVREVAAAQSAEAPAGPLAALAWMVGDWVDADEQATVETKVEWSANRRFLTCHFRVTSVGGESLVGTQVIGYDAAQRTIRSWLFDADGTIGEGTWTHDGRQWIVKSSQTLADGRRASSTNVYTLRDANSYAWKSIGRRVGEQFLPNIDEVIVVRKPAVAAAPAADDTPAAAASK